MQADFDELEFGPPEPETPPTIVHEAPVVVPEPEPPQSELRQRVRVHMDETYGHVTFTPKKVEIPSKYEQLKEYMELNWPKFERTFERLWDFRELLRRALLLLIGFICLGIVYALFTSREDAYVADYAQIKYVRHGHNGIDFYQASQVFSCTELEDDTLSGKVRDYEDVSITLMRVKAEYLLQEKDAPTCVCAPMYGTFRTLLSLRTSSSVVHMYNPELDSNWNGRVTDNLTLPRTRSRVIENQDILFPQKKGNYACVRDDAVRITYRNRKCTVHALILRNESAWCSQTCFDLLSGRAVHQQGKLVK